MPTLQQIIQNRTWIRRTTPFPHVVARNVFVPSAYRALSTQLQNILDRGLSDQPSGERFSRNIPGYDSFGVSLNQHSNRPSAIFLSTAWRDMICAIFGIGVTPYITVGSHHHTAGSKSGFIHNDYNPVWFPIKKGHGIQPAQTNICCYKTGAGPLKPSEKITVVRAVAVLFYLLNNDWKPDDGGETGLYHSAKAKVTEPVAMCPPINNSLLAFECTPHSYHTFIANKHHPRTSIIMWVHRTIEEADLKFGAEKLERWKS